MGGKKSKAPAAPDYSKLAQEDAVRQEDTARNLTQWNRPTQVDAYGNSINWSQDGNGNWTQSQTLNPYMQAGQTQALAGYLKSSQEMANQGSFNAPGMEWAIPEYNKALANGDFNANAGTIGDFTNTAGTIGNFDRTQGDQVAKDMYESSMSRLRPEQTRDTASMDLKLRQQGLQPGTEAYNRAMQNLTTSQGDVNSKLALDSTGAGYQAAQGIYNTNLAGQGQRYGQLQGDYAANLAGQGQRFGQAKDTYETNAAQDWKGAETGLALQQQQYNQALQNYSLPMERAQAAAQLYANAPQANFPGFSGATGYNPADMTGAANSAYQAKMGNYNAQQGKKNSTMSTAGTVGAAALMATATSDMTLKENIVPLEGKAALAKILSLGGYEYDWRDGTGHDMGVLAQQVQKVLPDLVVKATAGHLMVKYAGLVALLTEAVKYLAEGNHGDV